MSSRNRRPQWHEPAAAVGEMMDDPIEDTIEVGTVVLVDGPIDPVPLGSGPSSAEEFNPPRTSAGPMPDLKTTADKGQETMQSAAQAAQTLADKTQDAVQGIAGKAQDAAQTAAEKAKEAAQVVTDKASSAKAGIAGAGTASKSAVAGAAGSVGAGLWSVIQRSPLQAIVFIASLVWLIRNNSATAAQTPLTVTDAAQKVGTLSGQVQFAAGNLSSQVQDQARHGAGWFSRTLQENPLVIGAMALVAGLGLGLAVPETSYENKAIGKTRDQLLDKAQGAAQDIGHKVQTVAQTAVQEAIETAKEEAKNQGLTA